MQNSQDETSPSSTLSTSKTQEDEISPAALSLANDYINLVKDDDITSMQQMQQQLYTRMKESNRALKQFNDEASKKLVNISFDYHGHAKMLTEMKSDLEYITKKIK